MLVLGAGGQVGRAVAAALPGCTAWGRAELDIAAPFSLDLSGFDAVVNAAAYTDVDGAETPDGRVAAWRANATGPAALARAAAAHGSTLVHLSSEYVFDGRADGPYAEGAPIAPLSVYGSAKAAGDLAVGGLERHYLVRPTWVVGDGRNFVRTMLGLAARGVDPAVVADQVGRPTFATDIAAAIVHLLQARAPHGTYHVTGGGEPASWADVARAVFAAAGHDPARVRDTSTAEYFAGRPDAAPRPSNSVLDCTKAAKCGVELPDWRDRLPAYCDSTSTAHTR